MHKISTAPEITFKIKGKLIKYELIRLPQQNRAQKKLYIS